MGHFHWMIFDGSFSSIFGLGNTSDDVKNEERLNLPDMPQLKCNSLLNFITLALLNTTSVMAKLSGL